MTCRSCGIARALDEYRIFSSTADGDGGFQHKYMDFCVECERNEGTVVLYRRFSTYGTPEILQAVFAANRAPEQARSSEQARLLVTPQDRTPPETNEAVIQRELERRELSRRRLIFFVSQMMPKYMPGWVHQDIARRLEKFVDDVAAGRSPRLILAVPPRHGKLLAHDTVVPTPNGWAKHGDLRPGDTVFGVDGKPTRVIAVSQDAIADHEVTLYDGSVFVCHANHEWSVFDRSQHKERVVETRAFADTASERARFQLPSYEAIQTPADETLSIDPYFLGVWLGGGTSSNTRFCGAAADMAHIEARVPYDLGYRYVHPGTGVVYRYVLGVRAEMAALGLLNNKHIPPRYLRASEAQRRELLSGLVDTDGSVEEKTQRVRFRSASQALCLQVAELVRSLGYRASVDYTPPDARERAICGGASWCVQWTPHDGQGGGTLPRKVVSRVRARRRIGVKSVRKVPGVAGRCIQVEAADGLYLVGETFVPTHNSQLASDMFPSWVLGKYPDWELILASYGQELPIQFSRNIRDRVSDPVYQGIFPNTKVRPDAKGVEAWRTTANGGLKAIGVGGGLTGFGGRILIADDLIKDAMEASSEQIRQNAWDWYQMVFRSRLAPGGGILLIGTRWHWHDPIGRALELDAELTKQGVPEYERENWEVISYPAIAEHDEYLMRDLSIAHDIPDEDQDRVLRRLRVKGEVLHPERYALNEMRKIRNTLTAANWSALYQQAPTPEEGDYFKRSDFRYRWLDPAYRPLCRIFMTVDYAIGQKQRNDYTVMGVHALDSEDNLTTLDIVRGRWGTDDIARNVVALVIKHKPEIYAGEQGQIHSAVWPVIKRELSKHRLYISVDETLTPIQDKEARARPMQGRMQQGKHFFSYDTSARPEIMDVTERELLQFPNGVHDDIVDMLAWAGRLALNVSLPTFKAPPKQASWKDNLAAPPGGSYMAG